MHLDKKYSFVTRDEKKIDCYQLSDSKTYFSTIP